MTDYNNNYVIKMFKQLHPSHWPFNHYFVTNSMFIIRFTLCSWRSIHFIYCCLSKAYKHTCHIAGNKEQITKFTECYDITSSLWNHNKNLNGFCCCIVPLSCVSIEMQHLNHKWLQFCSWTAYSMWTDLLLYCNKHLWFCRFIFSNSQMEPEI